MAKRNYKQKRNEDRYEERETVKRNYKRRNEREVVHKDFGSFGEIIPVKAVPTFNISDWFKNTAQRLAYSVYEQHDVVFLLGPAGSGKTFLACMFAINDLILEKKSRIVLTRPIVEAGERLGYLPGDPAAKTDPYMLPLYDSIRKLIPSKDPLAEYLQGNTEVAPLAYLRGRTLDDSVCLLDEAQNCTWEQLLLYLTRLGNNSKMVITGDPTQSDIGRDSALMDVVSRLDGLEGVGKVVFTAEHIVRHKLVAQIISRLQQ